jgi:hypothetical protein
MPPVVARPWACVSRSTLLHRAPPLHPGDAAGGIDPHGLHVREVDGDSVVAHCSAGHVVAAAAYGDLQAVVASNSHGGHYVGGAAAAGDESEVAVNDAIPYGSGVVVGGVVSRDELAPESADFHRRCLLARLADLLAVGGVGPGHF